MSSIQIINATEGNLKNVTLQIPKNKLVVFTGLSGSGKSTLLIDVLFNECQRQYLEALSMEGIHKPKVERIRGASPAIVIGQTDANKNPRSTVGTVTDVYTDLRMVYEKLGLRRCPHCGAVICAADCREITEKIGSDFFVYMDCCQCGKRMSKITRTQLSFNTREGACPTCEGLGRIHSVQKERVVNEALALEQGAVAYWETQYTQYQAGVFYNALKYYGVPAQPGTPVGELTPLQKAIFYEGAECQAVQAACPSQKPPKTVAQGRFEGVLPVLWRRLADKGGDAKKLEEYFSIVLCPDCKGERLGELGRDVTVHNTRLPQLADFSLEKLSRWVNELQAALPTDQAKLVEAYLRDINTKLNRYINVGLGYLSLDRQTVTLSGGELQRLRLAAVLDSDLSGVIYILDEPTAGLHPKDTAGLVAILQKLRELENTVLVIEHDPDVMAAADHIVDVGPGSGKFGGQVVAQGTLAQIQAAPASATGRWLALPQPGKGSARPPKGEPIRIQNASRFNLKNINVNIPTGCLTAVTGPSGSGKSTLIFEVLAKGDGAAIAGLGQFEKCIEIEQSAITRMKRSNVATYSDVYAEVRAVFAKTPQARAAGLTAKHFSFNTPGGRCENCEGLGYVDSNMLFFTNIQVECPVCGGSRFGPEVLAVNYQGLSIKQALDLSVDEAAEFFAAHPKIIKGLALLQDVGLGYLELGQTLTTLSGGEGQRLKLAKELLGGTAGKQNLYLMDEPTTGLHPQDVEHFLVLLNRMVDAGNTVVVVEHNQQLIKNSDWVIDLGPEGGDKGGQIVFEGTPQQLAGDKTSVTARYL